MMEHDYRSKLFVGCECSGTVRDAFLRIGWRAVSCDLKPDMHKDYRHIQGDVFDALKAAPRQNLVIIHPPCTYLCSSGLHWNKRRPERAALTEAAIAFAIGLWELACSKAESVCMENPVGCLSTQFRKPDQIIQPYDYGEDASKATCLWLKNLPPLMPTNKIAPRIVNGLPRWANQTDSGQNRLGPSAERSAKRAETYPGIASAMAHQWGESLSWSFNP